MRVELGVFNGQHRVNHYLGYFLDGRQLASLFPEFANQHALRGKNPQWQHRPVIGQVRNIGQVGECYCQRNADDHDQ